MYFFLSVERRGCCASRTVHIAANAGRITHLISPAFCRVCAQCQTPGIEFICLRHTVVWCKPLCVIPLKRSELHVRKPRATNNGMNALRGPDVGHLPNALEHCGVHGEAGHACPLELPVISMCIQFSSYFGFFLFFAI